MNSRQFLTLFILAAIWGGSFILMRLISPETGASLAAFLRLFIGGVALISYLSLKKFPLRIRQFWKQYLILGVINFSIPIFCYSFSALYIPAAYSAIINSMSPIFAMAISFVWLDSEITFLKAIGIVSGIFGVWFIVASKSEGANLISTHAIIGILSCLLAAFCYGLTAVYIQKQNGKIPSKGIASVGQIMGSLFLLPSLFLSNNITTIHISSAQIVYILILALFCSAIAYVLYFGLIEAIGGTKALSVTFLMPLFSCIWGRVFLGEHLTRSMLIGGAFILIGTSCILMRNIQLPRLLQYLKTTRVSPTTP